MLEIIWPDIIKVSCSVTTARHGQAPETVIPEKAVNLGVGDCAIIKLTDMDEADQVTVIMRLDEVTVRGGQQVRKQCST